jgi:CHAT domain-containing protein/Flp pilus assembly protein TadD
MLVSMPVGIFGARAAGAQSPIAQYHAFPPDSTDARFALIDEDPTTFKASFDSVLAGAGLSDADWRRSLETAALDFLEATDDSVLISDLEFVSGASPRVATEWYQAVKLDEEGFTLRDAGEYEQSAEAFTTAGEIYTRIGHLRREAVAWGSLGVSLWYAGDLHAVRGAYDKALDARLRLGDPVLIGRTLNGLGSVNKNLGEYREALDFYRRARAVRETLDNPVDLGVTIAYIGNVYFDLGDLGEARAHYLEALELFGSDAPVRRLNEVRSGLAAVLGYLGETRRALEMNREILALAEETGDTRMAARVRMNAANQLVTLGEYSEALKELFQAKALQEEEGDLYHLVRTMNNLGVVYLELGDFSEALEAFREVGRLGEETTSPLTQAESTSNIAQVYFRMQMYDRALEVYERAQAAFEELESMTGVRNALNGKAITYYGQKDYEKAIEQYQEVLALDVELGIPSMQAQDHVNLGNSFGSVGRLDEALEAYRAGLSLGLEEGIKDAIWTSYMGMADCFEQAGKLDSARVYNQLSIEVLESQRSHALSEEMKTAFLARRAVAYESQVHVLGKLHRQRPDQNFNQQAFAVAERGKAQALRDMLTEGQVDLDAGLDPALVEERDNLETVLRSAQYQLRLATDEGASPDSIRILKRHIRNLENERQSLTGRMRLENPQFAAMDPGRPATLDEIRAALLPKKDHVLLEYSMGDSATYLWVVTQKDLVSYQLPVFPVIDDAARKLRASLRDPEARGDETFVETASLLYGMLLEPAGEVIAKAKIVHIVPDGALNFIPFNVLLAKQPAPPDPAADDETRNRYFSKLPYAFRKAQIHYGPSASTLVALATRPGRQRDSGDLLAFLGVGDPVFSSGSADPGGSSDLLPLPFTRDEVNSIAEHFDEDARTVLLGEDAAEKTLSEPGFLSRYEILHFATHGLIDERRPERSSLALSFPKDPSEDGHLQAAEIYKLEMSADLVVLSACETGTGRMVRGEGVLGLPRAFLYGGASSVMVSLWSVSDRSTAELMSAFYEQRTRKGRSDGEALRRAGEHLRKTEGFAHPFYWAPFVLMGPA